MNTLESLNEVASELIRRGLPADYAQRAAGEIADHRCNLIDELQAAGLSDMQAAAEASRRLGDSQTLIKKTVREYQRRFWCGRWPLVAFVLAPLPLLLLAWFAMSLVLVSIGWPAGIWGLEMGPQDGILSMKEHVIGGLYKATYSLALPALIMFALVRIARRAAMHWWWVGAAAFMLAIAAVTTRFGFPNAALHATFIDGSPVPADRFMLTIGLLLPASSAAGWSWYLSQLGQILLPMVVAGAMLLRRKQLVLHCQRSNAADC